MEEKMKKRNQEVHGQNIQKGTEERRNKHKIMSVVSLMKGGIETCAN